MTNPVTLCSRGPSAFGVGLGLTLMSENQSLKSVSSSTWLRQKARLLMILRGFSDSPTLSLGEPGPGTVFLLKPGHLNPAKLTLNS